MKISSEDLRLYGVTDRRNLGGESLEEAVEKIIRGGATCIQLREKHLGDEKFKALAKKLQKTCAKYGVPFIVNDRIEIAREIGADGVHIGQSDMPLSRARELLGGDFIIGTSAHSEAEAIKARDEGADYLGSGAVFPTGTKSDATRLDMEELKRICAVGLPVVAIGGIDEQNAHMLKGSGIAGIAVSSGLFSKEDKKHAAEILRKIVDDTVK